MASFFGGLARLAEDRAGHRGNAGEEGDEGCDEGLSNCRIGLFPIRQKYGIFNQEKSWSGDRAIFLSS
jgi:hypothetical protein